MAKKPEKDFLDDFADERQAESEADAKEAKEDAQDKAPEASEDDDPEPEGDDAQQEAEAEAQDDAPAKDAKPEKPKFEPKPDKKPLSFEDVDGIVKLSTENRELKRKLETFEKQQQEAKKQPPPSVFEDEDKYREWQQQELKTELLRQRVETSRVIAAQQYGKELVDEAYEAFDKAAKTEAQASAYSQSLVNDPHPIGKVVEWYKRQQFLNEVGDDPDAYKQRLIEEHLARQAQEAETQPAQGQPPPQPEQRKPPPPSLAKGGAAPNPKSKSSTPEERFNALFS